MVRTVISTFAGCGGSSLGYKLAGFKELLAVEWDDNAVETFKMNFPNVPVYHGDIKNLTGAECMELAGIAKGELDILDGSPPCQGFSTAGQRKYDDPRNSLFKEYARLLRLAAESLCHGKCDRHGQGAHEASIPDHHQDIA